MKKEWAINELTDETAMEWAKKPCWAWGEVFWLMVGLAPEAVNTTDYIQDMGAFGREVEALVRAVDAKSLVQLGTDKYGVAVFNPADIVRVAQAANIGNWRYWESVFAAMKSASRGASGQVAPKAEAVRSITKGAVINAFEGLHFDRYKWSKYLGDSPSWLKECRIARGSKKASALWNPVLIAAALLDKNITIKKLDAVFVCLKDWADEWRETSASFRD